MEKIGNKTSMTSRWIFGVIFSFALLLNSSISASFERQVDEAELFYKNQDYNKAIAIYSNLLSQYPHHNALRYNLGNSYLKSGELGKAIVQYRLGLRLSPRDKDYLTNLSHARSLKLDQIEKSIIRITDVLQPILAPLSYNEWSGLFFIFLSLFTLFFYHYRRGKRNELFSNGLAVVTALFFLFSIGFGLKTYSEFFNLEGVIVSKKAEVKSGPSNSFTTVFFVHDGSEVSILKSTNGWHEITLPNGLRGWVHDHQIWTI